MRLAIDIDALVAENDTMEQEVFEDLTFEKRFSAQREAQRTPSQAELANLTIEEEIDEPPMTCDDAFRIISLIKEREALRGD